jgi:hypothetical protein
MHYDLLNFSHCLIGWDLHKHLIKTECFTVIPPSANRLYTTGKRPKLCDEYCNAPCSLRILPNRLHHFFADGWGNLKSKMSALMRPQGRCNCVLTTSITRNIGCPHWRRRHYVVFASSFLRLYFTTCLSHDPSISAYCHRRKLRHGIQRP